MVDKQIGKYRITKDAPLLIADPSKKDFFGDVGTRVIKTLKQGDIIDVVKLGGGGRGISITPYLILADGSYVIGYNAEKINKGSFGGWDAKNFPMPNLYQTSKKEEGLYVFTSPYQIKISSLMGQLGNGITSADKVIKSFKVGDKIRGSIVITTTGIGRNSWFEGIIDGKKQSMPLNVVEKYDSRKKLKDAVYNPNQPKAQPKGEQYKFTRDFTATKFGGGVGGMTTMEYIAPRRFKKGEIVQGRTVVGASGNTYVLVGRHDVTDGVKPISKGIASRLGDPTKKLFTPTNIAIGVLSLVSVFAILKWKKVI
jgi:hypothetical protein